MTYQTKTPARIPAAMPMTAPKISPNVRRTAGRGGSSGAVSISVIQETNPFSKRSESGGEEEAQEQPFGGAAEAAEDEEADGERGDKEGKEDDGGPEGAWAWRMAIVVAGRAPEGKAEETDADDPAGRAEEEKEDAQEDLAAGGM